MNCDFCNKNLNTTLIIIKNYVQCNIDNCQKKISHKHNVWLYCINERISFIEYPSKSEKFVNRK